MRRSVPLRTALAAALAPLAGLGGLGGLAGLGAAAAQDAPAASAPPVLGPAEPATSPGPATRTYEQALGAPLASPDLGPSVGAAVIDLTTGRPVWQRAAGDAFVPASTTKLFTGAAALAALGPEHRFTTRVVAGATTGEVIVVGGGDPLLSAARGAVEGGVRVTPVAALVSSLVAALPDGSATAADPLVVSFDDSLFGPPSVPPTWESSYVRAGVAGVVDALALDGGRAEPELRERVPDPGQDAAEEVARRLTAAGIPAKAGTRTTARAGAPALASVTSAPLSRLVELMLEVSDNDVAEVLARHVAVARGQTPDAAGAAAAVAAAVEELGVHLEGSTVLDGSGLSRAAAVEPRDLAAVLVASADPARPELGPLLSGLPVAGLTGSLDQRFGAPVERAGAGLVRAKTGTLTGVTALAGTVVAADGRPYAFSFVADDTPDDPLDARAALDAAAAALARCGCR